MADFDIHSLSFYNLMGLAKADLNHDGKVSGDEETSIFNNYMQQFEKDNQKGLTQKDVDIYKSERSFTEQEKTAKKDLKLFEDTHDTSNLKNLSPEELKEYEKLLDATNINKDVRHFNFMNEVKSTLQYLLSRNMLDEFDGYFESYKSYKNNFETE